MYPVLSPSFGIAMVFLLWFCFLSELWTERSRAPTQMTHFTECETACAYDYLNAFMRGARC